MWRSDATWTVAHVASGSTVAVSIRAKRAPAGSVTSETAYEVKNPGLRMTVRRCGCVGAAAASVLDEEDIVKIGS